VVQTGASGFFTEILASGHALMADEPVAVGGSGRGPSPYDLLLAALGACTGMTLRMYADRKRWPLHGITVRLAHEKIHARDCETCDTKEGMVDRIDRGIAMLGPLDQEQRTRLMEIADRCPVHRTLHSEIEVRTRSID
jgi:putative redox protein